MPSNRNKKEGSVPKENRGRGRGRQDDYNKKQQEQVHQKQEKKEGQKTETQSVAIDLLPEMNVKHPLHNRWALWYLKADRNKDWEDCLKQISVFDTVEDYWALFNHIQGIKPMWEDEHNVKGGRWLVVVDKQKRHQLLDRYWQELLMAIVGEQFEDMSEYICGAVVNVRQKGDKVSLWTRDSSADEINTRIGYILKAKLRIPDGEPLRYEVHKDSSARTSSMVKPRILLQDKKKEKEAKEKEPKKTPEKETGQP